MRNIDKIKKMNSEELVEFIMEKYINDKCDACIFNQNECKGECRTGMTKWFDAINLDSELTKEEELILDYMKDKCIYIQRFDSCIRGFEINEEEEVIIKFTICDDKLFSWIPEETRIYVKDLLKIKKVKKNIEQENIETNETLYNLIETCRNKLLKIRVIKGKSKCRPIKNTRREDVYEVVWDLMNLFETFGLKSSYEVMKELQSREVRKHFTKND